MQEIAQVTEHANFQSLESYLAAPDGEDFIQYNNIMFAYHTDENNPQQSEVIPKKIKKTTPTSTISKPPEVATSTDKI